MACLESLYTITMTITITTTTTITVIIFIAMTIIIITITMKIREKAEHHCSPIKSLDLGFRGLMFGVALCRETLRWGGAG